MLLVLVLVTMATVFTATNARCKCLCCGDLCGKAITPKSALFLESEDIVLTCSIPGVPAEKLAFVKSGETEMIPEEFIHKVNATSIKMIIPDVTAQDIDETKDSTQYKCVNKSNINQCYDNVHVRLEYYPREPVNLDCRIYDFKEMTCTWSLGVEYHRSHDVDVICETASFSFKSDINRASSWAPCPDQNRTSCHWNSDNYLGPFMIITKVSVTAIEKNITKETTKKFYQYDIMVPGPVKELSVRRAQGERCVQLDWQPTIKYYKFRFNVSYSSACTPKQSFMVAFNGSSFDSYKFTGDRIICGVTPHTEYTYTVIGQLIEEKELDNRTLLPRGYWSAPTIITQHTDSDVLDVNPKLPSGMYDISSSTKPGFDSLGVYWTPLVDCVLHDAAENVFYKLTTYNKTYNKTVHAKHPKSYISIDIPRSTMLTVTLQSVNSIGPGPSPSVITVFPAIKGPNPFQLVIEYNKTGEICVRTAEIIVSEHKSNISDVFHTLVWCQGTKQVCQEPIKRKQLSSNRTSFKFDGNKCDIDYRYGLVTNGFHKGQGQIIDTGIQWEPCIYHLGIVPEVPLKNVHLTEIQPDNGFSVEWDNYNCDNVKAYIINNMVTYCVGQGSDKCKCTEDEVSVNISRQISSYTARDLKAGNQYCVWVRGVSKAGRGPANTKPLVHVVTAKLETSYTVVFVIIVVIVVVGVLAIIIICAYKKYQKWKDECSQIRVNEMEGQNLHLLDVTSLSNESSSNQHAGETAEEPEKPSERKYSIGDIIDVLKTEDDDLKGNYQNPTDIDSYMKAQSVSDHTCEPDDHDNERAPLIASETNESETENTIVNDLCDKFTVINGRSYVNRYDRNNEERDHYKSISSVLSDAHSEQTGVSMEDLLCHRYSADVNAMISTLNDMGTCLENHPKVTQEGQRTTETLKETGKDDVNDHGRETDKEYDKENAGPLNNCRDIVSGLEDDNKVNTTADGEKSEIEKCSIEIIRGNTNEIKSDLSVEDIDDVIWDSGDCTDLLGQYGKHKQTSDVVSEDSFKLISDDDLHNGGNVNLINSESKDTAESTDNGPTQNHEKEATGKGIDYSRMNGNVERDKENCTDKEHTGDNANKQSKKNNPTCDLERIDDQIKNKRVANILSKNSNGLILTKSDISSDKNRTSVGSNSSNELQSVASTDNSGTLHSYVTAGNDTSGEPIHNISDHDTQSGNIKSNTNNLNGGVNNYELIQECK
ncbi:uncharacterized protein LOC132740413 isoform X2 [Ruditapes philippinarum]|uniref:uncharacterized protein LOC132740413 isoform X2 n=1 Tax=Ruditapes philippinarum TaxID=129788 RepID=UPI00295BF681|nr:uncharacterized protein LOC132740413 isoform X2 [Ruditapes philippinarum]